jgi:ankyrin repeat protein
LVEAKDYAYLRKLLERDEGYTDITKIHDQQGYNLLHICAFTESDDIMRLLIKYAQNELEIEEEEYHSWMNEQAGAHMHTPLHLACFN